MVREGQRSRPAPSGTPGPMPRHAGPRRAPAERGTGVVLDAGGTPCLAASTDATIACRRRPRHVAALDTRGVEQARTLVPDGPREGRGTRRLGLRDGGSGERRAHVRWGRSCSRACAWLACGLATGQERSRRGPACRRARLGPPAHMGTGTRPLQAVGLRTGVRASLPRPRERLAYSHVGSRAGGTADGDRTAASRQVQRVRRSVATRPRRAGARALDQAGRL